MRFNNRGKMRDSHLSLLRRAYCLAVGGGSCVAVCARLPRFNRGARCCFLFVFFWFLDAPELHRLKPPDQKHSFLVRTRRFAARRASFTADCAQTGPVISRYGCSYYRCVHVSDVFFFFFKACTASFLVQLRSFIERLQDEARRGVEWPRLTR